MNTAFHATREAHAKLNVRLEVGPRAGALHSILSVIAQLEIADELRFAPASGGFAVVCDGLPIPERDNLVWRAAHAFGDPPAVEVTVRKHIPVQAGLGGGSADAAVTLQEFARILTALGQAPCDGALADAAIRIGSDVPSALVAGLKIVSGTGERVSAYPSTAPPWGIVLLKPTKGSDTAQAYALLDRAGARRQLGQSSFETARATCAAFAAADLQAFLGFLHNDFAAPVEIAFPEVADVRRKLARIGARGTILCGSGSCVAGFFETVAAAQAARDALVVDEGEWCAVTRFA
ncbi:MAG TPA: hypothetical protein VEJ41_04895 [Candidatus Acidoferrales bacterium]|nr:hypothetical protein [Candidatus Acidoferrales bacterium]